MIGKDDKPGRFYNDRPGFACIFFIAPKVKALLIIYSLLLFSENILCQCPTAALFKEQVVSVYNSPAKKNQIQLTELLSLEKQMKACNLDKDSTFMFLSQKIGILYSREFNYPGAIDYTRKSILIARECIRNQSCSTLALVDNYYNLFYYYGETGQLEKKYDAIDSCIAYVLKGNSGFDKVRQPLTNKVEYLFNKGEYSLCSRDAKLGEKIIQKYCHSKDSIVYIVFFVNKQANALFLSKNYPEAEKLLKSRIFQFEQTGNSDQLYAFLTLLGLINIQKKDYTNALLFFRRGFQNSLHINYRKGCATSLSSIATLYAKNFNMPDTGLKYSAKALEYADNTDSLYILKDMANIYVLKGMYERAQYFFQRAFNTVQDNMNETSLLQNSFQFPGFNLLQNLSDLTIDKGNAYVHQYYQTKNDSFLKKALNIYKKADLFLAKLKIEQQLQFSSNLVWRTTARNLYERAIEACYANNNMEDAFYFFEKSRAVLLNDQIHEQRWMADEDIAKQANIQKTISELERNLATVPVSSEEYLTIQKKLYTSSQELIILIRNIKNKSPAFYQSYLDTVFITIPQLRKTILTHSKVLLEIFSGDSAMYVLIITPNNESLTKINKQSYDSLTNSFNSFITNRNRLDKHFARFVKTARQLYGLIFQDKTLPYSSIIISPDGTNYPFEGLVMNENSQDPDYFLNHYATSYTYSVKYLTNQFATNTNTDISVLGIAPVQYKYHNLAALYGSDNSLKNINNYFSNATNYILEGATMNNFLQNFPRYNIIQLYTHAADSSVNEIDSSISNDPVIYFADSLLYLSDLVANRKTVTQLVVLSACETANGKLYQGEGIFSFNRGFAALGIPAAISTLWSVENESTYRITELFYKYLSQGLPTDIALQKAKLEFIHTSSSKEKKMPYFWAGTILTGKVDTIKNKPPSPWYKYTGAAILLSGMACLIMVFLKKMRSKSG